MDMVSMWIVSVVSCAHLRDKNDVATLLEIRRQVRGGVVSNDVLGAFEIYGSGHPCRQRVDIETKVSWQGQRRRKQAQEKGRHGKKDRGADGVP